MDTHLFKIKIKIAVCSVRYAPLPSVAMPDTYVLLAYDSSPKYNTHIFVSEIIL
jgi:hypothetical protein